MPLSVDQTLMKARKHLKYGALAEAEQLFRSILARFPKNKKAIEGINAVYRQQSSNTSQRAGPLQDQLQALIKLYNQGRLEEVIGKAEALITQFPKAFILYNILGAANAGLNKFDRAIENFTKALQIKPDYAEAYNNLGAALKDEGELDAAIESYTKALRFDPDLAEAHYNMGAALQGKDDLNAAMKSYGKALRIKPDYAEVHNNIGNLLQGKGDTDAAIESYARAIQFNPNYAEAHNNIGNVLQGKGETDAAKKSYTRALQFKPDYAEAHNNLGNVLLAKDDLDAAIDSYNKAIQFKPDYAEAHNNMGLALQDKYELDGAIESFTKALQIKSDYAETYRNITNVKKYKADDPLIANMSELLLNSNLSSSDQSHLSFALGKAMEDIGQYDKAFKFLSAGNSLRKSELSYDIDVDRKLFTLVKNTFQNDIPVLRTENCSFSLDEKTPVFIFGMPRSGTTLVEQILSSHSAVYGAGELEHLSTEIAKLGWSIAGVDEMKLNQLRKLYLARLSKLATAETYVTDKMPLNFIWIGFALSSLPKARFIHVQRDARATCWSLFKHYFTSRGNGYAYDLDDVVEYYKIYVELMSFWLAKFPDRIYDLNYETLTENQEAETRLLLKYVGLEWEDQCLDFHNNAREVRTASAIQVRQKMYKGSSQEWLKYKEHLTQFVQDLDGF
jgi:tetratricopeptide (TPR) repeat protein